MCIPTGHEDWEGHFCLCTVVFLYRGIEPQALGQGGISGVIKNTRAPPLVCFFCPRKTGVLATYRSPNGLLSTWGFMPARGNWEYAVTWTGGAFHTPRLRTCPPTWLIAERLSASCRLARHRICHIVWILPVYGYGGGAHTFGGFQPF